MDGVQEPAGNTMLAMVLQHTRRPLVAQRVPMPVPAAHQVLLKVLACGVCRTDLHIADGDLAPHKLPLILGHEVVGTVAGLGELVQDFSRPPASSCRRRSLPPEKAELWFAPAST
jgi:propanol-preferring alcohol dehydrogenase